jgi:uncharacterized integral membrane protein
MFVMWHTRILCKEFAMSWLIFIVFLLIGGLVSLIAVQNLTPVQLDVFSWHVASLPFGAWLIAAFLCGAIALYLISVLSALGDWRKMGALKKQVYALEEQIKAMTHASPSAAAQTQEDELSSADTGPMVSVSSGVVGGTMTTSQSEDRSPSSPLSPLQNLRP